MIGVSHLIRMYATPSGDSMECNGIRASLETVIRNREASPTSIASGNLPTLKKVSIIIVGTMSQFMVGNLQVPYLTMATEIVELPFGKW